jgi:acyl carrier protein
MAVDVEKKVIKIIEKKLSVDEALIKKAKSFEALGADSLDMVEIVMEIEEVFNLEISDEEAENIKSLSQAIDLINKKTS